MYLSLGSLMSGHALIAHERQQSSLEKLPCTHTHTHTDVGTLLYTSKTRSQTRVCVIPNILHPASLQTELSGGYAGLEITSVCASML